MKKYLRLITSIVLITPVLSLATTALVSAEGTSNATTTTPKTTTSDAVSPDDKSLLERLANRKAELKTKLTTVEQDRIKLKCKVAQGAGITTLETRMKVVDTARKAVYTNLVDRLTSLDTKLKAKNIDTAKLEAEIAILKTKIATFQTDLATYKQALVDLKSMGCMADPTAFRASLDSARTLREQVAKDATDIRTYVTSTIKPTLTDLKTQLEAAEKSSTSTTTGGR